MVTGHTASSWLIQRPDDPRGNFEAAVGCPVDASLPSRGFGHYYNDNHAGSPTSLTWQAAEQFVHAVDFPGPFFGTTLIMSTYGNLEVVAAEGGGQVAHFALVGIWGWQGPAFLPGVLAAGPPAFIQSRFGGTGNFEVIVPSADGGLVHVWRDNDHGDVWRLAAPPIATGNWTGVGLVHSSFGNLEIVGIMDGDLVFLWQNGAGGPWSAPFIIDRGLRGRPGFVQSDYGGASGNFEVVAARVDGGLSHYWRNNSAPNFPWSLPVTFHETADSGDLFEDVAVIQSSFANLEVLARQSRTSAVSHFRAAWAAPWVQPDLPWDFTC